MAKADDQKAVLRRMVRDAIRAGYALNVSNGGDTAELPHPSTDVEEVLGAMMATAEEHLVYYRNDRRRYAGWVWLIYANDTPEMIADHTMNLEPVLRDAIEVADTY